MYAMDEQTNRWTDGRTKAMLNAPFPTCGCIITIALLSRASIDVIGIQSVRLPRPGDESKPLNVYHRTFFSIMRSSIILVFKMLNIFAKYRRGHPLVILVPFLSYLTLNIMTLKYELEVTKGH